MNILHYCQKFVIKLSFKCHSEPKANTLTESFTSFRMTLILKWGLIKIVIKLIQLYQKIAPYCGVRKCCLFELSCSHYAINVFKKYGFLKGLWKTILRLLACQNLIKVPWFEKVKEIHHGE